MRRTFEARPKEMGCRSDGRTHNRVSTCAKRRPAARTLETYRSTNSTITPPTGRIVAEASSASCSGPAGLSS